MLEILHIATQWPVGHDQSAYKYHWHIAITHRKGVFLSDDYAHLSYLHDLDPLNYYNFDFFQLRETPEPLLKQETTSKPRNGKVKRGRMQWKSGPTTYRLWLHLLQLADYRQLSTVALGLLRMKKSKSTRAVRTF